MNKTKNIAEIIFILVNALAFFAAISQVVFFNLSNQDLAITLAIFNLLYIFFIGRWRPSFDFKLNPFGLAFLIFIVSIFVQVLISLLDGENYALPLAIIVIHLSLFQGLSTILCVKITRVYGILCACLVAATILSFFCLQVGFINVGDNIIPYGRSSLLDGNRATGITQVSNPAYLSIILQPGKGIPFFGDFGTLTSIFHEPHIATHFITPGILIFNLSKSSETLKNSVNFSFLIFVIISLSTTSIMCLFLVSILSVGLKYNSQKVKYLGIIAIVVFVSYARFSNIWAAGIESFLYKTQYDNSSRLFTENRWNYILGPSKLFGGGVLSHEGRGIDYGYVNTFFLLSFYGAFIWGSFKLVLSRKKGLLGLALLYFILHSLKTAQGIFLFPLVTLLTHVGYANLRQSERSLTRS